MKRVFPALFLCLFLTIPVFSATSEAAKLLPHAVVLWEASSVQTSSVQAAGFSVLGVGDLNGDKRPDLVASYDNKVQVLFGNGDGSFQPGPWSYYELVKYKEGMERPGRFVNRYWTPYPFQEIGGKKYVPTGDVVFPHGVVTDLDGDGRSDIVVTATFVPTEAKGVKYVLYVFRNEGQGQLSLAFRIVLNFEPTKVWVEDMNHDLRPDIILARAVKDKPTTVYVLYGEGEFAFSQPKTVFTGEGSPFCVRDIDGDGTPDLCLITGTGVHIQNGDGNGGFTGEYSFSLKDEQVNCAAIGDLNGDGRPDLVVSAGGKLISALETKTGEFVKMSSLDLGQRIWKIWVADLDGDGNPDILAELSGSHYDFLVITGDGKGDLLGVASTFVVPGGPFINVYLTDLNGDGRTDAVFPSFSGRGYRVYLNDGEPHGVTLQAVPGKPLALGDLDGNGEQDIAVGTPSGVDVLWNSGHGFTYSKLISDIPTPLAGVVMDGKLYVLSLIEGIGTEIQAFTASGKPVQRWRTREMAIPMLATGDFDGDGETDIAFPTKKELFVLWSGRRLQGYPWPGGDLSLIGAVHGSAGKRDELFAVSTSDYAYLVRASLTGRRLQVTEPLLKMAALPLALTVDDIDGDGVPDAAVIASVFTVQGQGDDAELKASGAILGLFLSSSGAKQTEIEDFPQGDVPWAFSGLVAGDFTGDGNIDLAFSTAGGAGLYIMAGKGNGDLSDPVRKDLPAGSLFAGDLDGNGVDELGAATAGVAPLLAILWNGGGK